MTGPIGEDHRPDAAARDAVERALTTIAREEPAVRAWARFDPDRARRIAAGLDAGSGAGLLYGTTFGIKDIYDTANYETGYGSPIFAGFAPRSDASAVALLEEAGSVPIGKTTTAEFAFLGGGITTNPHRAAHTPGGSSMGSAAAVAAGMVDIALGTQTAGSTIRPASYCGVFGFKPTFGQVSTVGIKILCPSLDTVGIFARSSADIAHAWQALTSRGRAAPRTHAPSVRVVRTPRWEDADADSRRVLAEAAAGVESHGGTVSRSDDLPPGLIEAHAAIMGFESVRSLAWEARTHFDRLGPAIRAALERNRLISPADYDAATGLRDRTVRDIDALFGDAEFILTPSSTGEAPRGLDFTGSPVFASTWTLLGCPAVGIPWGEGSTGLPVGVQLVARPGADARLLAACEWFENARSRTAR